MFTSNTLIVCLTVLHLTSEAGSDSTVIWNLSHKEQQRETKEK